MAKSLTPEQIKRRQEAKARSSKRNGTHWNKSRRDAALDLLFRKRPNPYTNKPAHPKLFKAIKAAGEKAEVRKQNRRAAREKSNLRNGLHSWMGVGDRGGVYSGNQDRKDAATKLRSKRSIARGQGPILTYSQTRRREAAKGRQSPEVRKRAADQLRALRSKGYKFTSNKRQIATDGVGGKWTGTKMVGKNAKLVVSRKYGEVVVDKYRKVSYTAKTGAPGAKWDKVDAKRVTGFGHPVGVKARALKAPKAKVAAPAKAAAPKATSGGGPTYGSKLHGQIKKSRGSSWLDKLTTPNPSTTIGSNDGPRLGPARTVSKARRRVQARMAQNAKHGLRSFEGVGSPEKIHGFSAARQARANILKRERKASKQAADRAIGRIKATNRSNIKHGLMIGTQKGEWSRKQKADILRRDHRAKLANSKAKRMDTLKVTATVHPWATKTPKADSWGRRNAKVRSSDRYGLTSTKRGSEERKAQAAKLRAERALNRSMDTPKIGTSLAGMSRERVSQLRALGSQAIAAHRQQKELDKTRAQVRKANGTHKAVPKARRPDPGGKKGFARYQAKLNSSKRVYGAFPKGTTAKPFSPERKFAASQLKAARKMGLRGNAARSHVRTAAQRAASIRNLMKARASRMRPGRPIFKRGK